MAFVSEVTAKMNIDKSGVERDLTAVQASFAKAGEAIDKQFSKGFGFKKLAKSLFSGLGFASASDLKELISKPFADAAESAKRIEDSTAETARIYEKIFSSRRTDEQNLAFNQRQQARLQKELAEVSQPQYQTVKGVFNPFTGKSEDVQRQVRPANLERAAEIAKELAALAEEENNLRQKMGREEKKVAEEKMRNADAFSKKQEELIQAQDDFLRSQMSAEDQIADIERERQDIAERIALSDEDTIDLQKRELELQKELARIEKERTAEAKRRAEQTKRIAEKLVEAGQAVEKSRADFAQELRDRSGFTLGEVATQRGNYAAKVTARNIQKLEEQAKRVRLTGGDFRDQSGKLVSREQYADQLITRADTMRKSLGMLTSKEADPMKGAAEAIKKSEEHLASIKTSLEPDQIE